MSPRELVILLLGLAIVAVILRGLYVALQARRGQIKLAIDKNIPQDVDLDALELAELPSGGARVVERSFAAVNSQNSAIEAANARAASLGLGTVQDEDESIPVLMDPVVLSEGSEQQQEIEDFDAAMQEPDIDAEVESEEYEDPDTVLFDYGEGRQASTEEEDDYGADELEEDDSSSGMYREDGMSSVMPDYHEDAWGDEEDDEDEIPEGFHEENFGDSSYDDEEEWDDGLGHESDYEEDLDEEFASDDEIIAAFKGSQAAAQPKEATEFDDIDGYDFDDDELDNETDEPQRQEPALGAKFEDSLEEFSMTAGERIGYNEPAKTQSPQSELFANDELETEEIGQVRKSKRGLKSLLSIFARAEKAEVADDESADEDTFIPDQFEELEGAEEFESAAFEAEPADIETREDLPAQEEESDHDSIQQSEVLVVNVMAREGRTFHGNDLLQVLVTSGLKFGEMNIFHHRLHNENKGPVIFSVANILNPGTFDLNDMENFSTIGVSLFLALPTQMNNLLAFEQMLNVAQQVRGALDGELKDDHRNVMTAQTIEHYRQRIRDFELRQLKTAGSSN
ncbi:MAG: cell division protein ZipA [Gammaproteobacteria bacterium]|nr:cell division protein ZipA [Gammaproteobacteria bacterium]MDD9960248.1 cell division protein ZipA [Gammaproteobacteria bacterium]